jgi:hypothetical protein
MPDPVKRMIRSDGMPEVWREVSEDHNWPFPDSEGGTIYLMIFGSFSRDSGSGLAGGLALGNESLAVTAKIPRLH